MVVPIFAVLTLALVILEHIQSDGVRNDSRLGGNEDGKGKKKGHSDRWKDEVQMVETVIAKKMAR